MRTFLFLIAALLTCACATTTAETVAETTTTAQPAAAATSVNMAFEDIPFKPFDPKKPEGIHVFPFQGNHKTGAFSAIVRFPPGFATPLHSHTASYSAVTLGEGLFHGANPDATEDLPKGSTWHQPAGEAHVDGCKGDSHCHFIVFFDGAVDMRPEEAPAAEAKAVVSHGDKLEWKEVKGGVKMAVIHGNPKEGPWQALIDFPAGMTTNVHTHSAAFSGALLSGTHHRGPNADSLVTLTPGSVWSEPAEAPHMEKCGAESRCIFAASMDGPLDTKAVELTPAASEPEASE